jgi:hypothetical protein
MLILAVFIILCAIIPSVESENYICIGDCEITPSPVPGNQPPILDSITDQEVMEGSLLTFTLHAADPEESFAFFMADIPQGAGIALSGTTFIFSWTPDYSQADNYYANFSVTDSGGLTDQQSVFIHVIDVNRPPIFANPLNPEIAENAMLIFNPQAMDPDGDSVIQNVVSTLPPGAQFNASSGNLTWVPNFTQAGIYVVNFSANDGNHIAYLPITITVINVNRPPVMANPGDQEIKENNTLVLTLRASDADAEPITYGSVTALPYGAELDPVSGLFVWTPDYGQHDSYAIIFTASDGIDKTYAPIEITVISTNRAPVLENPGNMSVSENMTLNFSLIATDPDGDMVKYGNSTSLPTGAFLNVSTGKFVWTPSFGQHGRYQINFSATDGTLADYEIMNITVTDVNGPPILNFIGNKEIYEGLSLVFVVNAIDPDGDSLVFKTSQLPERATFNATTGLFSWVPSYTQSGTYYVNFSVWDTGGFIDYESIMIYVLEPVQFQDPSINYAPVFSPIRIQTAAETYELTFSIKASDYDDTVLAYKALILPIGTSFDPSTRVFSWTPAYRSEGTYQAKFSVSDGRTTDTLSVVINVVEQPMPGHDCIQD